MKVDYEMEGENSLKRVKVRNKSDLNGLNLDYIDIHDRHIPDLVASFLE